MKAKAKVDVSSEAHTPTPWKLGNMQDRAKQGIMATASCRDGEVKEVLIADFSQPWIERDERIGNAALAVLAVNAYAEVLREREATGRTVGKAKEATIAAMEENDTLRAQNAALLAALESVAKVLEDGGCDSEDMDAAVKQARAAIKAAGGGK